MSFLITQTSQGGTNIQFNVFWSVSGADYKVQTDASLDQILITMFTIADYIVSTAIPDYRLLRSYPETEGATFGLGNLAAGYRAGVATSSGQTNTLYGSNAATRLSDGNGNTAVGYASLNGGTSQSNNTAVGKYALNSLQGTSAKNTAVGESAMLGALGGSFNSALGSEALYNNQGQGNIAVGYAALRTNELGSSNVAVGNSALNLSNSANFNTAIGLESLKVSTGDSNAAIGCASGDNLTTGVENTYLGAFTDCDVLATTTNRNVAIGYKATAPNLDGTLSIGGAGAFAMTNLNVATAGAVAAGEYLNIYINGVQRKIALLLPS